MNIKVGDFVKLKNEINYLDWYSPFVKEYNKLGEFEVIGFYDLHSDILKVKSKVCDNGYWGLELKYLQLSRIKPKEERVLQKIKQMYSNSKVPLERKWAESMS